MMADGDKKFLNALLLIPGVGYETISRLGEFFNSYEEAWRANESELKRTGIAEKIAEKIVQGRKCIEPEREMARLLAENITLIEASDPGFPELLKEIPSPPRWLYIKGKVDLNLSALAVVGSRKATSYGREATERIISGLSELTKIAITSGLAMGIDAQAHISSLKHNLPTIGVLGTGLDNQSFFPPKNMRLAQEIIDAGGAVISEYPLGMPGLAQNFIQRNRLISGISRGALIVEAAEKSGALITARFALEQGREVFAVPGSIFSPYSRGIHALLKDGATPVTKAEDIIEELNLPLKTFEEKAGASLTNDDEKNILENLEEPKSVDELKLKLGISTADIISGLSVLELKGLVKNAGGGKWMRAA